MNRDALDITIRRGCPLGPDACKWSVCANRPDMDSLAELLQMELRCVHYRAALDAMQHHVAEQLAETE